MKRDLALQHRKPHRSLALQGTRPEHCLGDEHNGAFDPGRVHVCDPARHFSASLLSSLSQHRLRALGDDKSVSDRPKQRHRVIAVP
jgi:hypothetical protein